jgi:hypothetical protein
MKLTPGSGKTRRFREWFWPKRKRFAFQPRLEQVLAAGLPAGPREALLLLEQSMAEASQPLPFSPEDLASALGVRLAWLAREMDSENTGVPGSLAEPHLERLENQAGQALDRIAPFAQDRYQLLFLLGLMVVELVDSTQAEN